MKRLSIRTRISLCKVPCIEVLEAPKLVRTETQRNSNRRWQICCWHQLSGRSFRGTVLPPSLHEEPGPCQPLHVPGNAWNRQACHRAALWSGITNKHSDDPRALRKTVYMQPNTFTDMALQRSLSVATVQRHQHRAFCSYAVRVAEINLLVATLKRWIFTCKGCRQIYRRKVQYERCMYMHICIYTCTHTYTRTHTYLRIHIYI